RHALAAMSRYDGQVVDVDLAPRLLEFRKLIGGKPADDGAVRKRRKSDELLPVEQLAEIGAVRLRACICLWLVEGLPHDRKQFAEQVDVVGSQLANDEVACRWHRHLIGFMRSNVGA